MCVQSDEEEEVVLEGNFGAAAAVTNVEVSSLHKKCVELALLLRTVFGVYRNATARRNYSTDKKQKESAERLFVRIQKAVDHPDSCFFNKKQRKQLTNMCLQLLPPPNGQQQGAEAGSPVPDALAAAAKVKVAELKSILRTAGLDTTGLKVPLLQRVQKNNLMHKLGNRTAAEALLKNYEMMHLGVGGEEAPADQAANGGGAAAEAEAAEPEAETEEPEAEADPAAEEAAAEQAPKPFAETALPHISDFYTTSTEGNKGRTWDIHAWQAMVKSKCPDLHLLPTEGDMTWSTEVVMPVMVSNSLPTGYTHQMHQFLAQHFDYTAGILWSLTCWQ